MYGTLSVSDLLATTTQTVAAFGEDRAFEALNADLAAHNALTRNMLDELAESTTDRLRRYGGISSVEMVEADEFGRANVQKTAPGQNVGFPLRNYQYALQWTRKWFLAHTPAELAGQYNAAKQADLRRIQAEIRRALYTPTNNTSYTDRYVDGVTIPLRALANADSTSLPSGPNGETFDGSTHTHYLATASLVAANISAEIATVTEHEASGDVRLYINSADEAAIRGMTSNFTPYFDARITPASTSQVGNAALNVSNTNNRAIGVFNNAEVWVKPWVLANYPVVVRVGGSVKPLALRTRDGGPLADLNIAADEEQHPLRAQFMEREFGIGVYGRLSAAVLYTGSGTYSAPSSF